MADVVRSSAVPGVAQVQRPTCDAGCIDNNISINPHVILAMALAQASTVNIVLMVFFAFCTSPIVRGGDR